MEQLPGVERVRRPFNPERQARPVEHRTPVVVLWQGAWRPGEVLAWWRPPGDGWVAQVRMRYGGQSDQAPWVKFDPALILPVWIDEDDADWWLPPATKKRDRTPGPDAGPCVT